MISATAKGSLKRTGLGDHGVADGGVGGLVDQDQRAGGADVVFDRGEYVFAALLAGSSVPTANTHVSRILAKLGARDRAQLMVIASQSGLVKAG